MPGVDIQELAQAIFAPVEERLLESLRREMQRTHPWDFHKNACRRSSLLDHGVIIEGELLAELDHDERVVHVTDFLKDQLTPRAWGAHGKKLKNLFAIELKKRKLEECEGSEKPLYIARVQGEYRPIYTEADTELMTSVFMQCRRRFHNIVTRDEALLKTHRKQRRIEDYFMPESDDGSQVFRRHGETAAPVSSTDAADNGVVVPANSSCVTPPVGHAVTGVAIHRSSIPEAAAELRLRAKRGDSDVCVCE